jgi:predicted phosphohydrolase
MLEIQIASDLHIESRKEKHLDPLDYFTPVAEILILAGDIGSLYLFDQFQNFMKKTCELFTYVIFIAGNHEYYVRKGYQHLQMNILKKKLQKIEKEIDNFYFLDKSSIKIGNVCIVGCTLWSETNNVPHNRVKIPDMSVEKYNMLHKQDLNYIKQMIKYCKKRDLKLFLVTHYCPTFDILPQTDEFSNLYCTNLNKLIETGAVDVWVFGHLHYNFDKIMKGGTHLVGNQKGKKRDCLTDYSLTKTISI